jgi:hypothetical protein
MVRKFSQDSADYSEPRTTAVSSMVLDNSMVFNKARTCIKDKDMQMTCIKEVKPFSDIPLVCAKPLSSFGSIQETPEERMEKLKKFRAMRKEQADIEYCKSLSDIQITIKEKELMENVRMFNPCFHEEEIMGAAREPLIGHEVTKEYRTKMIDWMIEVCTSFKFSKRTYFLAVAILDKYFIASH